MAQRDMQFKRELAICTAQASRALASAGPPLADPETAQTSVNANAEYQCWRPTLNVNAQCHNSMVRTNAELQYDIVSTYLVMMIWSRTSMFQLSKREQILSLSMLVLYTK